MPRIAQRAEVALFCFKHICGGLDLDQHPGRMSQVLPPITKPPPPPQIPSTPSVFLYQGENLIIGDPNIKF